MKHIQLFEAWYEERLPKLADHGDGTGTVVNDYPDADDSENVKNSIIQSYELASSGEGVKPILILGGSNSAMINLISSAAETVGAKIRTVDLASTEPEDLDTLMAEAMPGIYCLHNIERASDRVRSRLLYLSSNKVPAGSLFVVSGHYKVGPELSSAFGDRFKIFELL
jgi:hypothetical protein